MFIGSPGFSDVGKPLIGAVFHFNSTNTDDLNINVNRNEFHLKGDSIYSKFGKSLLAIDLNHDGIDDLVVSAPTYGEWRNTPIDDYYVKSYNGEILVFFGTKDIGIPPGAQPDLSIRTKSPDPFYNFGFTLRKSDCNEDGIQDLLIGSPYAVNENLEKGGMAGRVSIVTKLEPEATHASPRDSKIVYIEDIQSHSFSSESNYEWFGYDLSCYKTNLLVGSPGTRLLNTLQQGNGALYGFDLVTNKKIFILPIP